MNTGSSTTIFPSARAWTAAGESTPSRLCSTVASPVISSSMVSGTGAASLQRGSWASSRSASVSLMRTVAQRSTTPAAGGQTFSLGALTATEPQKLPGEPSHAP